MEHVRITSAANPIIKEIRSLQDKKGRQAAHAFLLEGLRLVNEAVDSGAEIRYFVVSDSFSDRAVPVMSKYADVKVIELPDPLFERTGGTNTPQGIMSVVEMPDQNPSEIIPDLRRAVVLENIQDPGNVGTIIRTADACGFDGVILSNDCADPFNPKVIRSTMGSIFHLPVIVVEDLYSAMEILKKNNVKIAAADLKNAITCWEADLSGNIAIVIGNEGNGITEKMLSSADLTITIPMPGKAESLNASSAASILLYECMKQMNLKL
jgi:TrmH family RNA methyltransferase